MSEFIVPPKVEDVPKVGGDDEDDDGDDNTPVPEEECKATFTPVIQLEAIEVKTHEEDEDIVYKERAKLFLFDETMLNRGTGSKTWNERGVGEVKLLKHKENSRIRILMRQEKTMKIIANHFVDPRITLVPMLSSDKALTWVAFDFSEGELIERTFAIRFKESDIVKEFTNQFSAAQKDNEKLMAGADSTTGAVEADEASKALEALSVKEPTEA